MMCIQGVDDVTGEALIQRDDDKPATVRARLETYQELTQPVLDFYRLELIMLSFLFCIPIIIVECSIYIFFVL